MVVTGLLCTISVIVSNVSCLALYSFFASILPTKRNLLTRLNTVLVLAITALVNTQARFDSKMCKVSEVFFKRDSFCLQCGVTLIAVTFPLSTSQAMILEFVLFWLAAFSQAVLVALSLTRIFLILKVNIKGSPGFNSF